FGDSGQIENHQKRWRPEDPCHPSDPYGRSKLEAERGLMELADENFTVSILRPPLVYGPGAKGNIVLLSKLIRALPLLPLGYAKNQRSVIFVGNLTHYIHSLLEKPKTGIFLPQDGKPLSILELVQKMSAALQKPVKLIWMPHFAVKLLSAIL